jgi:hypothetical protein
MGMNRLGLAGAIGLLVVIGCSSACSSESTEATGGTTGGGGSHQAGGTPNGGNAQGAGTPSGGNGNGGNGGTAASGGGTAGNGGSGGAAHIKTVFVIVMENKAWCQIEGNTTDAPYLNNTLLPMSAVALNYIGPQNGNLHPSEPNYIWMEAGDSLGIFNDDDPADNHQATTEHLTTQLDAAGISWRSYQEDISGTECPLTSVNDYKPKHNPMVYFDDITGTNNPADPTCIAHNRPLTELETDLVAGTAARYNFITPNMCNDMHDACEPLDNKIKQGDNWLALWMPRILASPQYLDNGAVFLTFDEAESTLPSGFCCILGNCPIAAVLTSPLAKVGYTNDIAYDHSSYLKTVQEIFGVGPLLRHAGDPGVNSLSDLFTVYP